MAYNCNVLCHCGEMGWITMLDEHLMMELLKYRAYRMDSVNDLIRFIRNKKNHLHELPPEAKELLEGEGKFIEYFTSRFPLLLVLLYEFSKIHFRDVSTIK